MALGTAYEALRPWPGTPMARRRRNEAARVEARGRGVTPTCMAGIEAEWFALPVWRLWTAMPPWTRLGAASRRLMREAA